MAYDGDLDAALRKDSMKSVVEGFCSVVKDMYYTEIADDEEFGEFMEGDQSKIEIIITNKGIKFVVTASKEPEDITPTRTGVPSVMDACAE